MSDSIMQIELENQLKATFLQAEALPDDEDAILPIFLKRKNTWKFYDLRNTKFIPEKDLKAEYGYLIFNKSDIKEMKEYSPEDSEAIYNTLLKKGKILKSEALKEFKSKSVSTFIEKIINDSA